MRRALFAAPLLALAVLVTVFFFGLDRDPSLLPSMLIGKPVPAFQLPSVFKGQPGLRSSDLKGAPMLLNVFASWCISCRIEHPLLLELKSRGFVIEGLDWKDEPSAGADYLRDNGDPYAKVGNDRSGRTGIDLGVSGVPETFIIDRLGRVRYKQVGPISADDWKKTIAPLIQELDSGA